MVHSTNEESCSERWNDLLWPDLGILQRPTIRDQCQRGIWQILTSSNKKAEDQSELKERTSRVKSRNARSFRHGGAMLEKPPKKGQSREIRLSVDLQSCATITIMNFRTFASLQQEILLPFAVTSHLFTIPQPPGNHSPNFCLYGFAYSGHCL